MKTCKSLIISSLLLMLCHCARTQNEFPAAWLFSINYAVQFPGGDMAQRFGTNTNIGITTEYMTKKNSWILGFEGNYIFGSTVKENVLSNLLHNNIIYGSDKAVASIGLKERGYYAGLFAGKLFSFSKNQRSGLRVTLGSGLLQHKIRIQDNNETVPQITGEYQKGYDRLTNGLAFNQFIGYQLISNNRRINFYIGAEFMQGFTQSRRDFDFDKMSADTEKRTDLLFGIRAGWTLPLYFNVNPDTIWY